MAIPSQLNIKDALLKYKDSTDKLSVMGSAIINYIKK